MYNRHVYRQKETSQSIKKPSRLHVFISVAITYDLCIYCEERFIKTYDGVIDLLEYLSISVS